MHNDPGPSVIEHHITSRDTPHPATRPRIRLGAAIVIVIASLAGAVAISLFRQHGEAATIDPAPLSTHAANTEAPTQPPGIVIVHVHGAIAKPGLYELSDGARVIDAVTAAGGFAHNAEHSGVNLARLITDAEQLWVPAVGEAPPVTHSTAPSQGAHGSLVNLNTASLTELDALPGIGPSLAARIIDWRERNAQFTSIDDLLSIDGFGEKTVTKLRELVTV